MGGAEHRGLVAVLRSVGLCDVHRATNLLARVCTCCKCDAGVILCRPPIASRSPDQWIRKCQRTRWSRAAGTDGTALRKRNKRPDGSCTKEQSGNTKEIRHAKKQDNKPDREKKSSKMWVEVHEIEVIFILNGVSVELSFVSESKEATELLNAAVGMILALVRYSGRVITRSHVPIPLMKEWKT